MVPVAKNPPVNAGDMCLIPGSRRSSRGGLAWKIPWTEAPVRLWL